MTSKHSQREQVIRCCVRSFVSVCNVTWNEVQNFYTKHFQCASIFFIHVRYWKRQIKDMIEHEAWRQKPKGSDWKIKRPLHPIIFEGSFLLRSFRSRTPSFDFCNRNSERNLILTSISGPRNIIAATDESAQMLEIARQSVAQVLSRRNLQDRH